MIKHNIFIKRENTQTPPKETLPYNLQCPPSKLPISATSAPPKLPRTCKASPLSIKDKSAPKNF